MDSRTLSGIGNPPPGIRGKGGQSFIFPARLKCLVLINCTGRELMHWLSAVVRDFHFWIGTAAGVLGVVLLAREQRKLSLLRQARERDAQLRKVLGY